MRVVFDLEFVFAGGERLSFETQEGRDAQSVIGDQLRFVLHPAPQLQEEIVVHAPQLLYSRFTRRALDDD
jgi:hypothetical protein